MAITFQRCLGPVAALEPRQYTTETLHGTPALRCVLCEQVYDLDAMHAVDRGGVVRYRWACPTEGCPFMEFLILEAFAEDAP